jgi:hypothetical protein
MKLTKSQLNELLNQHIGTGYIIIKTTNNNIRIMPTNVGKNRNRWFAGAETLEDYMLGLSEEIKEEES